MRKVLICEDEPVLAADLALIVEEAGHTVCGVFRNAREALSSAEKLDPDLAIIDLSLADGETGGAVAQTLQSFLTNPYRIRALNEFRRDGTADGEFQALYSRRVSAF